MILDGTELQIECFNRQIAEQEKTIGIVFSQQIKLFEDIYNIESYLANVYIDPYYNLVGKAEYTKLLVTAFMKNMNAIYSAYLLNKKGLYGSARTIMRYVFEYLMIAKFCSISSNPKLISAWEIGKPISMGNEIFNRIKKPSVGEFKDFWRIMCAYTHATIYSQQTSFVWEENEGEIRLNFIFLRMLLDCNYHLLNSHVANNAVNYYLKLYYKKYYLIQEKKSEIQGLLKFSRSNLKRNARKLIYDYKLKWTTK